MPSSSAQGSAMAGAVSSLPSRGLLVALLLLAATSPLASSATALSTKYYNKKCPGLQPAVRSAMAQAVAADPRAGASVLRLFFPDCLVNGCDASVLLDDNAPGGVIAGGEKGAAPNANSLRGFVVVDAARAAAEAASTEDPAGSIDAAFAAKMRGACPAGADGAVAPLDAVTPDRFDNGYFQALAQRRGLLHSDQLLFSGGSHDALVRKYARDGAAFARDFAKAMVRMGNLAPAPGTPLEVRINCHRPN